MNEQKKETYILEAGKVINEGWRIYKENAKLLLWISFLGVLISLANILVTYFKAQAVASPNTIIWSVSEKVIFLPNVFFGCMLSICTYLCIQEIYFGRETSFRQMYKNCYELFWRYLGTSIAYSLLWIPTVILLIIVTLIASKMPALMWILFIVALMPMGYLGTIYFFAIFATVFENRNTSYFKYSKELVKGNFWRILVLTAVLNGPTIIGALFQRMSPWYKTLGSLEKLTFGSAESFLMMFYTPLVTCIYTVMYFTLREKFLEEKESIPEGVDLLD